MILAMGRKEAGDCAVVGGLYVQLNGWRTPASLGVFCLIGALSSVGTNIGGSHYSRKSHA